MTGQADTDPHAIWQAYAEARKRCERSAGTELERALEAENEAVWAIIKSQSATSDDILRKLEVLKHTLHPTNGWKDGREKALLDSLIADIAAVLRKQP